LTKLIKVYYSTVLPVYLHQVQDQR